MRTIVVAGAILSACFVRDVNGGFLDATPKAKQEALIPEADAKLHLMEHKNQEQKQQVALDTKVDKKQDKVDDLWTPQDSWDKRVTAAYARLGARATGARATDERTMADVHKAWQRGFGAQEPLEPVPLEPVQARLGETRWASRPTNQAWVDERSADARPAIRSGLTNSQWADARPAIRSGLTNDAQVNGAQGQDMDASFAYVQKLADRAEELEYQASKKGASYRVKEAADQALKELEEADANAESIYKEPQANLSPPIRSGLTNDAQVNDGQGQDMDTSFAYVQKLADRAEALEHQASKEGASYKVKEAADQALKELEEADANAQSIYKEPLANMNLMVGKAGKKDNEEYNEADEEDMDNEADEEDNEDNEEDNEADEDTEEDNDADEAGGV